MEATTTQDETKTRKDVFGVISEKITGQLMQGNVPWQKPWSQQPTNLITKKPYRGINVILLGMEEYEHNFFLSFDQVHGIGGKVKKGSKGHPVMYWRKANDGTDGQKNGSYDYYTVFNIAQCENIPESYLSVVSETPAHPSPEYIIASMPNCPKIQHKELRAYYEVVDDIVHMPKKGNIKKTTEYYAMLFRQLVHSTGHDSRLGRAGLVEMHELSNDATFSKEDLVADIGVCFLMSITGLPIKFQNGPGYVPGWLGKFKGNKRLISIAAGEAQKAVDYILNSFGKEEVGDE